MCFGNSANTDRKQQLGAYGALNNQIGKLNSLGTNLTDAGSSATGAAVKHYSDILSGDPNRVAAANAPQVAQGQEQNSELLKQIANFGNRGGGTNQITNNAGATLRGNIIDSTGKARTDAASNLSTIGSNQTVQGIGADNDAASAASSLLSGSTAARTQSATLHAAAIQNWANLVTGVLSGKGVGPSLGGWQPS